MSPYDLIWMAESGHQQEGLGEQTGPYRHCLKSQDVTPGLAKGLGEQSLGSEDSRGQGRGGVREG